MLAAVVALGGILLASCSSTGYHYLKSSEDRTYFKVPDEWRVFDEHEVIDSIGKQLSPRERQLRLDTSWQVGFDASKKPNLDKHIAAATAKRPVGLATVEELDFDASDTLSTEALRNFYFPIDQAFDQKTGEVVSYENLEPDGGFHGIHIVAEIDDEKGRTITFDQTSILDQAQSKLYTLLVTCSAHCYDHYQDKIERVVDSWTVRN